MSKHAKKMDIHIAMDTGREWAISFSPETCNKKFLDRAREIYDNRLIPYAYNPDHPAELVFADMFGFFRALSGVKSITPSPDMALTESRDALLEEASCWLSIWEQLLTLTA